MSNTIEGFIERCSDTVKKNVVIVTPQDLPTPYFLHITAERKPKYVPRIGLRQADSEDRTVPRITVSPWLAGCVIGYASMLWDFLDQNTLNGKGKLNDWKGGFYIQKLMFQKALKPSKKLVYDQEASDEHWLVSYSPETADYQGEVIGKIVVDRIELIPKEPGRYEVEYVFFLESKEIVAVKPDSLLSPGYYQLRFVDNRKSTFEKAEVEVIEITEASYRKRKVEVASNLSVSPEKAVYSKW